MCSVFCLFSRTLPSDGAVYFVISRGLVLNSYYFLLTVFVVFFEQTVSLFSLLVKCHRIFRKKGLVISCLFEIVSPLLAL